MEVEIWLKIKWIQVFSANNIPKLYKYNRSKRLKVPTSRKETLLAFTGDLDKQISSAISQLLSGTGVIEYKTKMCLASGSIPCDHCGENKPTFDHEVLHCSKWILMREQAGISNLKVPDLFKNQGNINRLISFYKMRYTKAE